MRGRILEELNMDTGARHLGEFAIGVNSKARIVDAFVEAEKVVGTIHVAFGGSYRPKTHLGLLIESPTVTAYRGDGSGFTVMERSQRRFHSGSRSQTFVSAFYLRFSVR